MENIEMKAKTKAVEILINLKVYSPFVDKFKQDGTITIFRYGGIGYWVDKSQNEDVYQKAQELEKNHNLLIYGAIENFIEDMECVTFLILEKNEDSLEYQETEPFSIEGCPVKGLYAYSYTLNKTVPEYSEFGEVIIGRHPATGGLVRLY